MWMRASTLWACRRVWNRGECVKVSISTRLAATKQQIVAQVKTSKLLRHVSFPLLLFTSRERGGFPIEWQEGEHRAFMWMLGFIPLGSQTISIELPPERDGVFRVRDNGSGWLIKTWDHWITIRADGPDAVHYTDEVTIRAGVLTLFVFAFARVFYLWRQHRWRRLVRRGFRY